MNSIRSDLVLAGGGLANCLIAWRVAQKHPDATITIIESAPEIAGNHTWSFHGGDLTLEQKHAIEPLIGHRWSRQKVAFPDFERTLDTPYFSVRSESLQRFIHGLDQVEILTGCHVSALGQQWVRTGSGRIFSAGAVIDGRGPGRSKGLVLGFQKFLGREVRIREPHGLTAPVIMDATVSQHDGYRFVYLLPFSADSLLIEDTRYSDGDSLDDRNLRRAIDQYAADKGWSIVETLREEHGVLPILLAGHLDRFWPDPEQAVARSGLAAGLFHPTTGYSLPQAISLADEIAARWPLDGAALAHLTHDFTRRFWRHTRFFRLLNRMLFRAGRPDRRYRVLERFYRLSSPLITNFYAADLKLHQQARIISGKPPVPVGQALPLINERKFLEREFSI